MYGSGNRASRTTSLSERTLSRSNHLLVELEVLTHLVVALEHPRWGSTMPTTSKSKFFLRVCSLTLALITWACGKKTAPEVLRFGLTGTPDILDVPYFVALDRGYFQAEGLTVQYQQVEGDATTIQALVAGNLDFASSGNFAMIRAVARGADIRAVMAVVNSHDYSLVGRRRFQVVGALRGGTIGIFAPGDITEVLTQAALELEGLRRSDVEWVSLGGSDARLRALVTDRVSAVPLHIDLTAQALCDTTLHEILPIYARVPALHSVVSVSRKFYLSNPQTLQAAMRALLRAVRTTHDSLQVFVEVAKAHLSGFSDEELVRLHSMLVRRNLLALNGALTDSAMKVSIALLARADSGSFASVPVDSVANLQALDAVLKTVERFPEPKHARAVDSLVTVGCRGRG
jgi:ABC-type nitrate/sulfonate/bicarbonate transport system substrate-binding protein